MADWNFDKIDEVMNSFSFAGPRPSIFPKLQSCVTVSDEDILKARLRDNVIEASRKYVAERCHTRTIDKTKRYLLLNELSQAIDRFNEFERKTKA